LLGVGRVVNGISKDIDGMEEMETEFMIVFVTKMMLLLTNTESMGRRQNGYLCRLS
jgi:hypothetical protein